MKLTIEKVQDGVKVELAMPTRAKPLSILLDPAAIKEIAAIADEIALDPTQLKAIAGMLQTALKAGKFHFSMDV